MKPPTELDNWIRVLPVEKPGYYYYANRVNNLAIWIRTYTNYTKAEALKSVKNVKVNDGISCWLPADPKVKAQVQCAYDHKNGMVFLTFEKADLALGQRLSKEFRTASTRVK